MKMYKRIQRTGTQLIKYESISPERKFIHKNVNQENNPQRSDWDAAKPFEAIPGPKPLPIIGNMWRFFPGIGEYYNKTPKDLQLLWMKQFGNIFAIRGIFGRRDLVILIEPEDTETVLRNEGIWPHREFGTSFAYYRNHIRTDVFKGAGGVLSVQGEQWHNFRTVINPILMQPKNVQNYVGIMDDVASQLVDNIRYFSTLNQEGQMPDKFLYELYKWALESVGVVTLDKRFGCLDLNLPSDSEAFKFVNSVLELFDLIFKLDFQPQFIKTYTADWKRFVKVLDFITDTNVKYIDEALSKLDKSTPANEMSVLQKLIQKDRQIAIATAMDMLMAGVDTTGKSLGACLYFLACNPDKQETFRKEIMKYLPNKESPVNNEVIKNMQYTKAIIRETQRIAPITLGTFRTMVKDITVRGYQIPKGTDVSSFFWYHSNSDKYFIHPKQFIPERWLKSTTGALTHKNVHPFVLLPFGFGPRSCIGQRLANLELETVLPKIIRNFELSWPHEEMRFGGTLLYGIDAPLKLHVKPLPN